MLPNFRHAHMTSLAVLAIALGACVTNPLGLSAQNNVLLPLTFDQPNTSVVKTPNTFLLGWNLGYPARQTMDALQSNVPDLSFSVLDAQRRERAIQLRSSC